MKKLLLIFGTVLLISSCQDNTSFIEEDIPDIFNLIGGTNEVTINQIIDGNSVSRLVYLRTPQNLNSSLSYPIVFFFHGGGGSGQHFLYNNNLIELINSEEFIGVFPNGYSNNGSNGGYWNLGSEPTNADDIEFVDLIIELLATSPLIDTSKAYAVGFSNGSGMVNLLGKSTSHFNALSMVRTVNASFNCILIVFNEGKHEKPSWAYEFRTQRTDQTERGALFSVRICISSIVIVAYFGE